MKVTDIYQTLEDRHNYEEVEEHGPFFCSVKYPNGSLKRGTKEPWLGNGYYFWDTRISDAHWWGRTVYTKGYIICQSTYDQHSPYLYDLVSNVDQFDEFVKCAQLIKDERQINSVTFPVVLDYLKKKAIGFNFKAIRVWPHPERYKETIVRFPGDKLFLALTDKIQICFFDKTLLVHPYKIVYKNTSVAEQTI
jgi:hypothetical protein